jgi:hypothetical protein
MYISNGYFRGLANYLILKAMRYVILCSSYVSHIFILFILIDWSQELDLEPVWGAQPQIIAPDGHSGNDGQSPSQFCRQHVDHGGPAGNEDLLSSVPPW